MPPSSSLDTGARRLGILPMDRGFQVGLRCAVLSPPISLAITGFLIPSIVSEPEMGLGWGMLHIAAFGVIEAIWIIPVALVSVALRFRRFALGLVVGGGLLLVANGLAWLAGLAVGAQ